MLAKPCLGIGVGRRTGHDCQWHVRAMAAAHRPKFPQQDVKQAGTGDRTDWHDPLGALAPQARSLATGDEHRTDMPQSQCPSADGRGGLGSWPAERQAGGGDRIGQAGSEVGTGCLRRAACRSCEVAKARYLIPIDRFQLGTQPPTPCCVQGVIEAEHFALADGRDGGDKRGRQSIHGRNPPAVQVRPRTQAQRTKQRSGKPRKITP